MCRTASLTGIVMLAALVVSLCGCGGEGGLMGASGPEVGALLPGALTGGTELPEALRGRIAFIRNEQVWVINADGTRPAQLTNTAEGNKNPDWSPDGKRIVFARRIAGGSDIFVMNADGSGVRRITTGPAGQTNDKPAWSPNGKQIAFCRNLRIYVMNADGTSAKPLTKGLQGAEDHPSWSPDGAQITFYRVGPTGGVYVASTKASGERRLPAGAMAVSWPAWSPNGAEIAFTGDPTGTMRYHVYVVKAKGGGLKQVTFGATSDWHPGWSPDSTRIVFSSQRTGGGDLYTVRAHGGGQKRLTQWPEQESQPDWWASR